MPSILIQPGREYRVNFRLFEEYSRLDFEAARILAAQIDDSFLRGQQWDDDRPLTLAEANISEADVEDGYELYKGQLRRKT